MDTWAASESWLLEIMLQWILGCLYSFELEFQVFSDRFPEVESLGHKAVPFLIFWSNTILLSTVAAPVCIPTNSAQGFPFLHNTCCLIYWWLFDCTHPIGCGLASPRGWDLYFPNDSLCLVSCHVFIGCLYIFLGKCLCICFSHF